MPSIKRNYFQTTGIAVPNTSGRLRAAPRISSAARASNLPNNIRPIDPGPALKLQFQEPLIKPDDVMSFTKSLEAKALKAQDEENNLLAKEAVLKLKAAYRDLGFNPEKGYFGTRGRESVVGREVVETQANQIARDVLESVEPAIQQKVLASVLTEKNSFLNRVAEFSISQKLNWEQDVQNAQIDNLKAFLNTSVASVEDSHAAAVLGANDIFPDNPDGSVNMVNQNQRRNLIEDLAHTQVQLLIDSPGGVEAATQRYEFYQNKVSVTTQQRMLQTLEQGIQEHNNKIKAQESEVERRINKFKDSNEDRFLADALAGNQPLSENDLSTLLKRGHISSGFATKYFNTYIKKDDRPGDDKNFINYLEAMSPENSEQILGAAMLDPEVTLPQIKELRTLRNNLQEDEFKTAFKEGKEEIDATIQGPTWSKSLFSREVERNKVYAYQELRAGLRAGKPKEQVMQNIRDRYGLGSNDQIRLPALSDGSRPATVEELRQAQRTINEKVQIGRLDQEEASIQMRLLQEYMRNVKNARKQ